MTTQGRGVVGTLETLAALRTRLPEPVVATSGGFDPIHVGHLRCLEAARALGGCLVVIVNEDRYVRAKKGYVFMPLAERMEILAALRCVDYVIPYDDGTDHVSGAIRALRPAVFAKGITLARPEDLPEWEACQVTGCRVALDVGGAKSWSSSEMVDRAARGLPDR